MFAFFEALFDGFIGLCLQLLPVSPFQSFIQGFHSLSYLGYLNWFFPVGDCLQILGVWLTSIAALYLIQVLLRWVRVVQ